MNMVPVYAASSDARDVGLSPWSFSFFLFSRTLWQDDSADTMAYSVTVAYLE